MPADDPDRNALLQKLMGLIAGDLSSRDHEELEGLMKSISSLRAPKGQSVMISSNKAVTVLLHPKATREAVVTGLQQTADWIEENWEELAKRRSGAPEPQPELLN